MTITKKAFIILGFLALTGCGSTISVKKPLEIMPGLQVTYSVGEIKDLTEQVPEHFLTTIKSYVKSELKNRQMLADNDSSGAHKVNIVVTSYRMRSNISRVMFGAFAGKDGVESEVSVVDASTNAVLGESKVSTFNVTAVGGPEDIARMHGTEIVNFLSGNSEKN
jgi:hypothetical protein